MNGSVGRWAGSQRLAAGAREHGWFVAGIALLPMAQLIGKGFDDTRASIEFPCAMLAISLIGLGYAKLAIAARCGRHGPSSEDHAHRERVAMVGALTASLVDSFSRPVGVVLDHAEAAARWLDRPQPEWDEVRASVAEIGDAARRIAVRIHRTRAFVSPPQQTSETVGIAMILRNATALLGRELAAGRVTLRCSIDPSLPEITCDSARVEQAVIHLIMNGIEILRGRDAAARLLEITAQRDGDDYVRVAVTHGPGLGGPGDALAIAICRDVIEAHGGTLRSTSTPDRGSTLSITLPANVQRPAQSRKRARRSPLHT